MGLPDIGTMWVEGRLSYIEYMCLTSMKRCGHKVTLFTYGDVENVPAGVIVRDANTILPRQKLLKHKKSGSYSLGSNIFRYELLKQTDCIWLDADVYCLKPIPRLDGYVFGWESENVVNGAVLGLPSNCEMLKGIEEYYSARVFTPPWWSRRRKINNHLRSIIGIDKKAESAGWGVLGPKAITYFVRSCGLEQKAQQKEVFYPIHIDDILEIFEEPAKPKRFLNENTVSIHLWNEIIKHKKMEMPSSNSFVYHLWSKAALDDETLRSLL